MASEVHALQSAIRSLHRGKAPRAVRYPAGLRARVTVLVQDRQAAGESLPALARHLGIPTVTLERWLQACAPAPRFRRIDLAATPSDDVESGGNHLALVTPTGYRVEGLTLAAVRELLGLRS